MEHHNLQKKNYFGPNAIHGTPRPKYNSDMAKNLASEGKYRMANWIDDWHSITKSDSHNCRQIHGANMITEVGPKQGIGLPPHLAGKNFDFKDETGSYISGRDFCLLMGWKQTERGKRRK